MNIIYVIKGYLYIQTNSKFKYLNSKQSKNKIYFIT